MNETTLLTLKCEGEPIPCDFETVMALLLKGRIIVAADAGAHDFSSVFDDAENNAYSCIDGLMGPDGECVVEVAVGNKTYLVQQKNRHPLPGFQWRMKSQS